LISFLPREDFNKKFAVVLIWALMHVWRPYHFKDSLSLSLSLSFLLYLVLDWVFSLHLLCTNATLTFEMVFFRPTVADYRQDNKTGAAIIFFKAETFQKSFIKTLRLDRKIDRGHTSLLSFRDPCNQKNGVGKKWCVYFKSRKKSSYYS
jgi:hypothetical protein